MKNLELATKYNQLRQEVLDELTKFVLENQKPCEYVWLEDIEVIDFEIGEARFLRAYNGVLKPIDALGYYVPIEDFTLEVLLKFMNKDV